MASSVVRSRRLFHHSVRLFAVSDTEFKAAKDRVSTLTQDPGNDVKLKMYALYKQVSYCKLDKVIFITILKYYMFKYRVSRKKVWCSRLSIF